MHEYERHENSSQVQTRLTPRAPDGADAPRVRRAVGQPMS